MFWNNFETNRKKLENKTRTLTRFGNDSQKEQNKNTTVL